MANQVNPQALTSAPNSSAVMEWTVSLRSTDERRSCHGAAPIVWHGTAAFVTILLQSARRRVRRLRPQRIRCFLERDDKSEEHTSELQSLMRISYAVFCLKKKKKKNKKKQTPGKEYARTETKKNKDK